MGVTNEFNALGPVDEAFVDPVVLVKEAEVVLEPGALM